MLGSVSPSFQKAGPPLWERSVFQPQIDCLQWPSLLQSNDRLGKHRHTCCNLLTSSRNSSCSFDAEPISMRQETRWSSGGSIRYSSISWSSFLRCNTFQPGWRVPSSGVYRVHHYHHRVSHLVIIYRGETFPECLTCKHLVRFEEVIRRDVF